MGVLKKEILKLVFALIICFGCQNAKAIEVIVWHSLDGRLGTVFNDLVEKFNQTQAEAGTNNRIVPLFKGSYEQTLRLGLKMLGTNEAPHILQVYDMGNWVMQAKAKDTLPLNKLTSSPSPLLSKNQFLPAIAAFYQSRDFDASLSSLPFMAGSVVLFYNKDALQKAGLDAEKPPLTWEEFEIEAKQLKERGAKNVLAAGWLSGHHIDQLAAWHNESVATHGNGMDGKGAELNVNRPFFEFHLRKLSEWHRLKIFNLETGPQAEKVFAKGQVIFLTQGVNRLPQLERLVNNRFEIGVGPFPYWAQKVGAPYNTVPGGRFLLGFEGTS